MWIYDHSNVLTINIWKSLIETVNKRFAVGDSLHRVLKVLTAKIYFFLFAYSQFYIENKNIYAKTSANSAHVMVCMFDSSTKVVQNGKVFEQLYRKIGAHSLAAAILH